MIKKIIALLLVIASVLCAYACTKTPADTTDGTSVSGIDDVDPEILKSDIERAHEWIKDKIENNSLFNFRYGTEQFNRKADLWEKKVSESKDADGNTVYTVTYERDKLVVTAEIKVYEKTAALDWVCYFKNNASSDSKAISNIMPLETTLEITEPKLFYAHGSEGDGTTDFAPKEHDFAKKASIKLTSLGGRSSEGTMPYFNVYNGETGYMIAIGWTGNWKCEMERITSKEFDVAAGMKNTDIALHAGEDMRTPSIVMCFYTGDRDDGQNALRRLILSDYTMKGTDGKPVTELPLTINCWGSTSEEDLLNRIKTAESTGYQYDVLWIDAGWYGTEASADTYDEAWSRMVGNWYFNESILPNGFKKVSEALKKNGKGLLVWFEPERVYKDSEIWTKHPDWVITQNEWQGLFNFANDDAVAFISERVSSIIKENGITWYRQDFNIQPENMWNKADGFGHRSGITEIKYITNLYKYIDKLIADNPGLLMDNCASGGKRLDIEMMKRSVPLWRSDYYVNGKRTLMEEAKLIGYNLSLWIPLSCGGQSSDGISDTYSFRTAMGSGMTLGLPTSNIGWWSERINEYKTFRKYMVYDYYILASGTQENCDKENSAYEYFSPEEQKGCILAFRPEKSTKRNLELNLKGLDPDATYTLTVSDNGEVKTGTGFSLMNGGLTVTISGARDSVLIYIDKVTE